MCVWSIFPSHVLCRHLHSLTRTRMSFLCFFRQSLTRTGLPSSSSSLTGKPLWLWEVSASTWRTRDMSSSALKLTGSRTITSRAVQKEITRTIPGSEVALKLWEVTGTVFAKSFVAMVFSLSLLEWFFNSERIKMTWKRNWTQTKKNRKRLQKWLCNIELHFAPWLVNTWKSWYRTDRRLRFFCTFCLKLKVSADKLVTWQVVKESIVHICSPIQLMKITSISNIASMIF